MIKKSVSIVLMLIFLAPFTAPAFSDGPVTKLGRGICNIATSPLEFFNQVKITNQSSGGCAAATVGLLKGVFWIAGRALVGVFETATFILPWPDDYGPILRDPEYFFENMPA
ncbi:MAG: exosortase system-associated protein, TIGR04073 family [Candidatus Omnitrophica bacterium]|nr:exosortase system-associated protein, TIGR04073 family [Candidatus Omnitrophota bacterium]